MSEAGAAGAAGSEGAAGQGGAGQGGAGAGAGASTMFTGVFEKLNPDNQAMFKAKGWDPSKPDFDINALGDSYRSVEAMVGKNNLPPPRTDDFGEYQKWTGHKALGVPDKAEGYQVKRPQMPEGMSYDEELEKALIPAAHKFRLPQIALQGLIDEFSAFQVKRQKEFTTMQTSNKQAMNAELDRAWGAAREAQENKAKGAYQRLAQGMKLNEKLLADGLSFMMGDANVMKFFAGLDGLIGEDGALLGGGAGGGGDGTPDGAQAQIHALEADPEFQKAYHDPTHVGHKDAIARMDRLDRLVAASKPQQQQ